MNKDILIPHPPSLEDMIKEIPLLRKRYHNRVNPDYAQEDLDDGMDRIFKAFLDHHKKEDSLSYIKKLSKEVLPSIEFHKDYFDVIRPNVLAEKLGYDFEYDYLKSAQTPSYPSGHTTQAYYIALVLSEKYPELKDSLMLIAHLIAESRIDRGVHFKSDNDAGVMLAIALFKKDKNKEIKLINNASEILYDAGLKKESKYLKEIILNYI